MSNGTKSGLSDLNEILFQAIEGIMNDDLSDEELEREIKRGEAVKGIAGVIIQNGQLALQTMKHMNEFGYGVKGEKSMLAPVPKMLDTRSDE